MELPYKKDFYCWSPHVDECGRVSSLQSPCIEIESSKIYAFYAEYDLRL